MTISRKSKAVVPSAANLRLGIWRTADSNHGAESPGRHEYLVGGLVPVISVIIFRTTRTDTTPGAIGSAGPIESLPILTDAEIEFPVRSQSSVWSGACVCDGRVWMGAVCSPRERKQCEKNAQQPVRLSAADPVDGRWDGGLCGSHGVVVVRYPPCIA